MTFPAASIFGHPFTYKLGITDVAYGSLQEFVDHAIEIERALVADAVAAGARYVQFDFPLYPYLVDPRGSSGSRSAGTTWHAGRRRDRRRHARCWRASRTT